MIDWSSFFIGMTSAFVVSAVLIGLIVWREDRSKRLKAYDQFENFPEGYQ